MVQKMVLKTETEKDGMLYIVFALKIWKYTGFLQLFLVTFPAALRDMSSIFAK